MKKLLLNCMALLAFTTFSFAQTQNISFEASEGYTLGDINNQNGWMYYYDSPANSGMIVSNSATQGTRSLQVISDSSEDEVIIEKNVTGYNITHYSFDFKIDGLGFSDYTMGVYDSSINAVAFFEIDYQTGVISTLTDADSTQNTPLYVTPGTYYNFKMIVNITTRTVQFFVNNTPYGTKNFSSLVQNFSNIDFAYDNYGTGFSVDNIVIQNGANLGVEDHVVNTIAVYPNPTADYIQIKTAENLLNTVVIDMQGKVVLSDYSGSDRLDLTPLSAGVYVVKATTATGVLEQKVVKN